MFYFLWDRAIFSRNSQSEEIIPYTGSGVLYFQVQRVISHSPAHIFLQMKANSVHSASPYMFFQQVLFSFEQLFSEQVLNSTSVQGDQAAIQNSRWGRT